MLINGQAIVGVDPGLGGAFACYRDGQWSFLDMPITGDAKHHEINIPELLNWLREQKPDHAFLEFAAARPKQGVSGMFRLGAAYGTAKTTLVACGIPYTVVAPQKWKKSVGIIAAEPGAKDSDKKELGRQRALQLFPDQAAHLKRKMDHARSDAMLLAYYGIQKLQVGI